MGCQDERNGERWKGTTSNRSWEILATYVKCNRRGEIGPSIYFHQFHFDGSPSLDVYFTFLINKLLSIKCSIYAARLEENVRRFKDIVRENVTEHEMRLITKENVIYPRKI